MNITYAASINESLKDLLENNPSCYFVGEDILDPYGGAFKVSQGLSTKFPSKVITTPISEAGIVGICGGMALRGLRPIVEIMFGDFITLATDQIINHLSKYREMYNNQVNCPVIIRTPMGGGRGYGPTHSQSLEKIFLGVPGLKIISPSHFHDPGQLLKEIFHNTRDPVLFIEHKLLYNQRILTNSSECLFIERQFDGLYPTVIVKNYNIGDPDICIISYGGLSKVIGKYMEDMVDEEIKVVACFPANIGEPSLEMFSQWVNLTKRVVIIEEGTEGFNWSSQISNNLYQNYPDIIVKCISSKSTVIPAAKYLEEICLPTYSDIEKVVLEVLGLE